LIQSNLTFHVDAGIEVVVFHKHEGTQRAVGTMEVVSPDDFDGDRVIIEVQAFHKNRDVLEAVSLCRSGGGMDRNIEFITVNVSLPLQYYLLRNGFTVEGRSRTKAKLR
jgi:hypothetical protein